MAFTQDWEITLVDQDNNAAWEEDENQVRRIYNSPVWLEKRNPKGKYLAGKLWKGRMRMSYAPPWFQTPARGAQEDDPIEIDPDELSMDYTPAPPDVGSSTHSSPKATQVDEDLPPLEEEDWDIHDWSEDNLRVECFFDEIHREWVSNDSVLRYNLGQYLEKNLPKK